MPSCPEDSAFQRTLQHQHILHPLQQLCISSVSAQPFQVLGESSAKLALSTARAQRYEQHWAELHLAEISHQTSLNVPVNCARLSSSPPLPPSSLGHERIPNPVEMRISLNWTSEPGQTDGVLFSLKPTSHSDYGPSSLKRPLCLFPFLGCFHGLASWLHRKLGEN